MTMPLPQDTPPAPGFNRRRFLRAALMSAAAIGLGSGLYTWRWEPHWLEIVQRRLPLWNPRYTAGEFSLAGNRQLYINRGVGYVMRVRCNVRPEITVFHLTPT